MFFIPAIVPYLQHHPELATPPVAAGDGVALIGRLTLGRDAQFGSLAVIRADGHFVTVGDDFWMSARASVHIAHGILPTVIGSGVTVGTNAVVHACTVGDHCVIEDHAVVLDGATVGAGCVVAAGSVVVPRAELPAGHWCEGSPAKAVRVVTPEQLAAARVRIRGLSLAASFGLLGGAPRGSGPTNFVAPNARLYGHVVLEEHASIWYSCALHAGAHEIVVGKGSNVQDNSVLVADEGPLRIGADVTVGHNVTMHACAVGDRALIGMGSVLAAGTVVEDDVLLAAGAVTRPGQRLDAGYLYAGRPARRLSALDEAKRQIIAYGAEHYRQYNKDYLQGGTG